MTVASISALVASRAPTLTASEARALLAEVRATLHPASDASRNSAPERVVWPRALPPVALVRAVIAGVSVVIERDRDGVLTGHTNAGGEVRGWGGLTSMDGEQLRHLAALARALRTHGDDGRQGPASPYDSVGGGS